MDRAQRRAERRADDAAFAVEFAYAAIEEAEYAVLDAELARMEAEERSSPKAVLGGARDRTRVLGAVHLVRLL